MPAAAAGGVGVRGLGCGYGGFLGDGAAFAVREAGEERGLGCGGFVGAAHGCLLN